MSKIAEALAKAKERTGTTSAPFLAGRVVVPSPELAAAQQAAFRKGRRAQRFWLILTSVAAVLTALIIWQQLSPDETFKLPSPFSADPASPPETEPPPPTTLPTDSQSIQVVLPPKAGANTPAPPPGAPPSPELYNIVNSLVISAVLPGDNPRLMFKGRIIQVGERVEGELIFAGVQDSQLVFNDKNGAVYVRRY